jgi:hypothetical protein
VEKVTFILMMANVERVTFILMMVQGGEGDLYFEDGPRWRG